MNRFPFKYLCVFIIITQCFFCSYNVQTFDDVNFEIIEPLKEVIAQDLIPFQDSILPQIVIDSLSKYRAIIFGEFHNILEERKLVAHLALSLSRFGNQIEICTECPDAFSWIYELISLGEVEKLPQWAKHLMMVPVLDSVQNYNSHHNASIMLHCIDVNFAPYNFSQSIRHLANYMEIKKFNDFIKANIYHSSRDYVANLNKLKSIMEQNPEELDLSKSHRFYTTILRMVIAELTSVEVRNLWNSNHTIAAGIREELIKSNADSILSQSKANIIFHNGANHAQKGSYMGSPIEWIGAYLHYRSPYSKNNSISIVGVPLKGETLHPTNLERFHFNLGKTSKPDDLFRLVSQYNNVQYSYLPLSNPIFKNKKIRAHFIFDNNHVVMPLKNLYDAFIIIPNGTYIGMHY